MTACDWLKEQREVEWTLAISGGPDEPYVYVKRTALLPVSSFAKAEQLADGADKALNALEAVLGDVASQPNSNDYLSEWERGYRAAMLDVERLITNVL